MIGGGAMGDKGCGRPESGGIDWKWRERRRRMLPSTFLHFSSPDSALSGISLASLDSTSSDRRMVEWAHIWTLWTTNYTLRRFLIFPSIYPHPTPSPSLLRSLP